MKLCIHVMFHGSSPWVFPHSEICGSMLICSSPQLIAACHVLLRLLMPRHSPYALIRLNFLFSFFWTSSLELLEFLLKQMFLVFFAVKRFDPFYVVFRPVWYLYHTFGNCSFCYPNLERPILISLLKCVLFYLFVSTQLYFIRFSMNAFFLRALLLESWWAQVDSNHRPRAYQARALTTWAMSPLS